MIDWYMNKALIIGRFTRAHFCISISPCCCCRWERKWKTNDPLFNCDDDDSLFHPPPWIVVIVVDHRHHHHSSSSWANSVQIKIWIADIENGKCQLPIVLLYLAYFLSLLIHCDVIGFGFRSSCLQTLLYVYRPTRCLCRIVSLSTSPKEKNEANCESTNRFAWCPWAIMI